MYNNKWTGFGRVLLPPSRTICSTASTLPVRISILHSHMLNTSISLEVRRVSQISISAFKVCLSNSSPLMRKRDPEWAFLCYSSSDSILIFVSGALHVITCTSFVFTWRCLIFTFVPTMANEFDPTSSFHIAYIMLSTLLSTTSSSQWGKISK